MFEFLTVAVFIWLLAKTFGLALRLTWGFAKVVAGILMVLALPALILSLLFAGGILLLIPLAMVAIAAGVAKACL